MSLRLAAAASRSSPRGLRRLFSTSPISSFIPPSMASTETPKREMADPSTNLFVSDGAFNKKRGEYAISKPRKPLEEEKRKRKKGISVDTEKAIHISEEDESGYATSKPLEENEKRKKGINVDTEKAIHISEEGENKYATSKPLEEKKRKRKKGINVDIEKAVRISEEEDKSIKAAEEKNENKSRKKKRKGEKKNDDEIGIYEKLGAKADDSLEVKNFGLSVADVGMKMRTVKSKGAKKKRKNDDHTMKKGDLLLKEKHDIDQDDVYHISSGDEYCSAGMKKWITEYHQSRPGLKVLQQRIDDFISAHEARLELERKGREEQAAEGGWTVVVHHKGRKKTTDSESGITVGSVAQAAVEDKLTKKKQKGVVGLDFYRFKKRDDRRNEILTLLSKFEQDKKQIQQMRAARKFKPY